jgi:hypothetical protein
MPRVVQDAGASCNDQGAAGVYGTNDFCSIDHTLILLVADIFYCPVDLVEY